MMNLAPLLNFDGFHYKSIIERGYKYEYINPDHRPRKPGQNGNVSKHVHLEFGEVDALMADSDVVVEGEYFFEGTTHTPIEPHCAIGYYDPSGKLTVWSATQVPHYLHRELARVLDLDVAKVRVIQPPVGGAFGVDQVIGEIHRHYDVERTDQATRRQIVSRQRFAAERQSLTRHRRLQRQIGVAEARAALGIDIVDAGRAQPHLPIERL